MPLIIGTTNIGDIYKGTTKIDSVYKGTTLVYTSGTWEQYLYELIYYSLVPTTINSKQVKNRARVNTIYGNSVVENQLIDNAQSTSSSNGITFTNNNNGSWSITGTASAFASKNVISIRPQIISGHTYLLKGCPSGGSTSTYEIEVAGSSVDIRDRGNGAIYTSTYTEYVYAYILVRSGYAVSGSINFYPQLIDLTQMFPINTPTTLNDTRVQALLNRGYIAYNTGTIKNVDVSEISSTKSDTTALQTISFKYQGSGVGTAHDTLEITSSAYVFTKNMNSVDLGTLNYTLASNGYFATIISDMLLGEINSTLNNALCEKYPVYSNLNRGEYTDKGINYGYAGGGFSIRIKDTSISTDNPTTFKSGLANTKFEYQLATQQVISIPKKHLGVVDLGTLTWYYDSTSGHEDMYSAVLDGIKLPLNTEIANVFCVKYVSTTRDNVYSHTINGSISIQSNGRVRIYSTDMGTNPTDFKNAMNGVYLFYETQNEIADIPVSLGVESGGTLTTNWFSWKKNQQLPIPTISSQTFNGITLTNNNDGTITIQGTASDDTTFTLMGNLSRNIPLGHYVMITNFANPSNTTYYLYDAYESGLTSTQFNSPNGYIKQKAGSSTTISPRINIKNGTVITTPQTIKVEYIDLTLAFGSGNEPTNINDPRIQYIINQGYIPTDTTGTDTLADSQVLPNLLMEIKCK